MERHRRRSGDREPKERCHLVRRGFFGDLAHLVSIQLGVGGASIVFIDEVRPAGVWNCPTDGERIKGAAIGVVGALAFEGT